MQLVPKLKPSREKAGEMNTLLFPPTPSTLPSSPTGHVPMAKFKLPGDKDQDNNREELAQVIAERHMVFENVLDMRPCAKNFAHTKFQSQKGEILELLFIFYR